MPAAARSDPTGLSVAKSRTSFNPAAASSDPTGLSAANDVTQKPVVNRCRTVAVPVRKLAASSCAQFGHRLRHRWQRLPCRYGSCLFPGNGIVGDKWKPPA
jgi:hypothetical protein